MGNGMLRFLETVTTILFDIVLILTIIIGIRLVVRFVTHDLLIWLRKK